MEKQISIIIPTYNMEKYIAKCLDSLLIPEFDQVEVLVVNDGSKDRSSEIAHSYADRYPDSIRVIDKQNGNYGSCINAALPLCTGRYVKVLDADDTFDTEAFSRLIRAIKNCSSDVVFSDYIIVDEQGRTTNYLTPNLTGNHVDISFEGFEDMMIKFSQMHGITYRTKLLIEMEYHQTEGISFTDTEWTYGPLAIAKDFSYYEEVGPVYKYLVGRTGQTMDPKLFHKKLPDQIKVLLSRAIVYERLRDGLSKSQLEFLIESFKNQSHYIYLAVLSSDNRLSKHLIYEYEKKLKDISSRLYDSIGLLNYTPYTPYKMVKAFRAAKDPLSFRIPMLQVCRRKFNGLLNRLSHK